MYFYPDIFLRDVISKGDLKTRAPKHGFHLVSVSPWPVAMSFAVLNLPMNSILFWNKISGSGYALALSFILVLWTFFYWLKDVSTESDYLGAHTSFVQSGINKGFGIFVASEALFFAAIFWAFFHSALAPDIEIGGVWPPFGIEPIDAYELPLLNTMILLSSGAFVTYSHHCLIKGRRNGALNGLLVTILLGLLFTYFQYQEYLTSTFTIADGIFGTTFYFATGFHSFHVMLGVLFLVASFKRMYNYKFTSQHHVGYSTSLIYWHFVDVVWLFVLTFLYFWGS